jgi:hypothetical protein
MTHTQARARERDGELNARPATLARFVRTVDNQVVNMLFEEGKTASFSMIAFTKEVPHLPPTLTRPHARTHARTRSVNARPDRRGLLLEVCTRKTRIFGSRGQLEGDGHRITTFDFNSLQTASFCPTEEDAKPNTKLTGTPTTVCRERACRVCRVCCVSDAPRHRRH